MVGQICCCVFFFFIIIIWLTGCGVYLRPTLIIGFHYSSLDERMELPQIMAVLRKKNTINILNRFWKWKLDIGRHGIFFSQNVNMKYVNI